MFILHTFLQHFTPNISPSTTLLPPSSLRSSVGRRVVSGVPPTGLRASFFGPSPAGPPPVRGPSAHGGCYAAPWVRAPQTYSPSFFGASGLGRLSHRSVTPSTTGELLYGPSDLQLPFRSVVTSLLLRCSLLITPIHSLRASFFGPSFVGRGLFVGRYVF